MAISWNTPETREFLAELLSSNKKREDKIKEIVENFETAAGQFDTVMVQGCRGVVVWTTYAYGLEIGLDSTDQALTVRSIHGLEECE